MEIKEIRRKTDKELNRLLAEKRDKLRELRFKIKSRQVKNYKEMQQVKRDIARILTVLNERRFLKSK